MIDIVGNIFVVKFAHHHQNDGALELQMIILYKYDTIICTIQITLRVLSL